MCIHSGLTQSMTEEIQKIYAAEDHSVDFMDWDGFLDSFEQLSHSNPDNQIDMLGSLLMCKPAPAYRYLTYALLELFQGDRLTYSQFRKKAEQYRQPLCELSQAVKTVRECRACCTGSNRRTADGGS